MAVAAESESGGVQSVQAGSESGSALGSGSESLSGGVENHPVGIGNQTGGPLSAGSASQSGGAFGGQGRSTSGGPFSTGETASQGVNYNGRTSNEGAPVPAPPSVPEKEPTSANIEPPALRSSEQLPEASVRNYHWTQKRKFANAKPARTTM